MVKAVDCDSTIRGFDPRRSPFENIGTSLSIGCKFCLPCLRTLGVKGELDYLDYDKGSLPISRDFCQVMLWMLSELFRCVKFCVNVREIQCRNKSPLNNSVILLFAWNFVMISA